MKSKKLFGLGLAILVAAIWSIGPAWADPCTLITPAEAETVLGEPVKAPVNKKVVGLAPGLSCTYLTAAPLAKRGGVGSLKLFVYDSKTMKENDSPFESPEAWYKKYFQARRTGKVEPVPNLGQEARWTPGSDSLHVLAKGAYLVLQIKDLVKMTAPTRAELSQKLSEHRKKKSIQAMTDYILPRLN